MDTSDCDQGFVYLAICNLAVCCCASVPQGCMLLLLAVSAASATAALLTSQPSDLSSLYCCPQEFQALSKLGRHPTQLLWHLLLEVRAAMQAKVETAQAQEAAGTLADTVAEVAEGTIEAAEEMTVEVEEMVGVGEQMIGGAGLTEQKGVTRAEEAGLTGPRGHHLEG